MKTLKITAATLLVVGAFLTSSAYFSETDNHCATCTGSKYCNACKNCKYCKHCSVNGGTCGVCR